MSTPVETAIRTHLQANDAVQETIEWSEIMTRLDTDILPVTVPRRRRRVGRGRGLVRCALRGGCP